ncbi:Uncharacterized conserved protein [Amycolatopsis marina]|uniref:Uncharacterized conserved protein n=1 Tax=Amycolatopsis marina TaxID=490629 RepID=A0A1I0YL67_9PSEU|nr:YciI family protein [Amycolatopsis marina]SFB14064.1 Uncharacterized conserved protein [Amycolatopsis marina]
MKYLILIYSNPETWDSLSAEQRQRVSREHDALDRELGESGELVGSEALAERSQTKTVRARAGSPVVTDGPFAEAKEQLAGFYLLDCESVERAVEIAGRLPDIELCAVEVRPVMDLAGLEM